jgi:hypothetical protein
MEVVSRQLYRNLFISWFIAIPFGASCLSLEILEVEIYPSLLFAAVLFVASIAKVKFNWSLTEFFIICLLSLPLLVELLHSSFFHYPNIQSKSIFLSTVFFSMLNFIMGLKIMGNERFVDVLRIGIRIFIGVLLFFGLFELLTGIHIQGFFTYSLRENTFSNANFAPVFIYDSPMIYLTFLFLLSILLLWVDERFRKSRGGVFALFILIYFFSYLSNNFFGKSAAFLVCIALIIINFYEWRKFIYAYRFGILFASCMLIALLIANSFYFGRLWKKAPPQNTSTTLSIQTNKNSPDYWEYNANTLQHFSFFGNISSNENNGATTLFQKTSPQSTNLFVLLIDKYGIAGLSFPFLLIFASWKILLQKERSFYFKFWFVFGNGLFIYFTFLPIDFLNLDITWFYFAVLLVFLLQAFKNYNELPRSK